MPSEGVMLTRIAIDCRVWFAGKCLLDLSLRRLGNELVLLGQVHQQRRIKTVDHAQIFLSRSEEHTSELQSRLHLVCRLLLEKKKTRDIPLSTTHTIKLT